MTEAEAARFPAWMAHDGVCTHAPEDPDHIALVRAQFGGRDTIELVTPLIPPGGSSGRTWVWWWGLPLFWLWHRHERATIRAATAALIGVRLTLSDGTTMEVRVSARAVAGLLAAFPEG